MTGPLQGPEVEDGGTAAAGGGLAWRSNRRLRSTVSALFAAGVLSLSLPLVYLVAADSRVLGLEFSTVHNLLVLGSIVPAALVLGVRRWGNPVLIASGALLLLGFTLGSRLPELTVLQSFKTFFALSLGALAFEIRLPARLRAFLVSALPWVASINLGAGLLLSFLGDRSFYRIDWGAFRLQGTVVPAHLAYLSLIGLLFSLLASFDRKSWLGMAVANFAILTWAGSRAAILEGLLLITAWLVVDGLRARRGLAVLRRRERWLVAAAGLVVLASYGPFMAARMAAFHAHQPGEVLELVPGELEISATGRLRAWRFFWGVAEENLWFGRGLGAGVTASVGQLHSAFRVPHNEYLRLIVDGGLVGLALLVLAYVLVGRQVVRSLGRDPLRFFAAAALGAFAFDALLRNPLSAQHFMIPFWLFLGAISAADADGGRVREAG